MSSQGLLQTEDTATAAQRQRSEEGHRWEALAAKHAEAQGCTKAARGIWWPLFWGENHSFQEQKEMTEE